MKLHPALLLLSVSLGSIGSLCAGPTQNAGPTPKATSSQQAPEVADKLRSLESGDWILRAEALSFLAKRRVEKAVVPCRRLIGDEAASDWLRGRALVALVEISGESAVGEVLPFAKHESQAMRFACAEALAFLSEAKATEALEQLLGDADAQVAARALASYAQRFQAESWKGVESWKSVEAQSREVDSAILPLIARALAFVNTEESMARLEKLCEKKHLSRVALRGLHDLDHPGLVPWFLRRLGQGSVRGRNSRTILRSLRRQENGALVKGLTEHLKEAGPAGVTSVSRVLSELKAVPELAEPLRSAMAKVTDPAVLREGLTALGSREMEPDRYRSFFVSYLAHDDARVRELSIRCLAHCESANLYEHLKPRLSDGERRVVVTALESLRRAPIDTAPRGRMLDFLREPLSSVDDQVRTLAYDLLGHAGSQDDFAPAMQFLRELLRGRNEKLRSAAAKALGEIAPLDGVARIAKVQGYLSSWRVIGTFLNDRKNSGFDTVFPPDEEIDFEAKYKAKYIWTLDGGNKEPIEREISWMEAAVDRSDGKLILPQFLPPPATLSVAYAVADFDWLGDGVLKDGIVRLFVEGDDSFRVWLNGKKVAEKVAEYKHRQPCVAEQDGIELPLKKGRNRIVVKSTNIDHEWWIRL
ncbi:MAG: HEAT repeat domain-containing protein, partial [Planctomycetota bacterium]